MSEPTMRELIERATPGPWHWEPSGALVHDTLIRPKEYVLWPENTLRNEEPLCLENHVEHWRNATGACGDISEKAAPYNAQLIARCSPATMAAVLSALETARHRLRNSGCANEEVDSIQHALALLNRTENHR